MFPEEVPDTIKDALFEASEFKVKMPEFERFPFILTEFAAATLNVAPLSTVKLLTVIFELITGEVPWAVIPTLSVEVGTPSLQFDEVAQSEEVPPVHVVKVSEATSVKASPTIT